MIHNSLPHVLDARASALKGMQRYKVFLNYAKKV